MVKKSARFNSGVLRTTYLASNFKWIIHDYGLFMCFNSITNKVLLFQVDAAIDLFPDRSNLMHIFAKNPHTLSISPELLAYIKDSKSPNIQACYAIIPSLNIASN